MGTKGGVDCPAVAYLAGQEFFEVVSLLQSYSWGFEGFLLVVHGDITGICTANKGRSKLNKLKMSYQHSYNNYLGHVLNKSPSKTAYSFSRAERFPTQPTELSPTDLELCMHANGHSYHPSRHSPTRRLAQPQRISPTHYYQNTYSANSDDAVKRELQKILRKIEER